MDLPSDRRNNYPAFRHIRNYVVVIFWRTEETMYPKAKMKPVRKG